MFLTLRNEKTLKKMRSKTLKNNIFFFLGRNLIIRSFEIPHSIWKLHKDFKSVFVFKFRQKTKKFTPKWQKPLFEKRVPECYNDSIEMDNTVMHVRLQGTNLGSSEDQCKHCLEGSRSNQRALSLIQLLPTNNFGVGSSSLGLLVFGVVFKPSDRPHVKRKSLDWMDVSPGWTFLSPVMDVLPGWMLLSPVMDVSPVFNSVKQCSRVLNSVKKFSTVFNSVQECSIVLNSVQQCSTVFNSVQEC